MVLTGLNALLALRETCLEASVDIGRWVRLCSRGACPSQVADHFDAVAATEAWQQAPREVLDQVAR